MSIETFEELYEEVKKLYPKLEMTNKEQAKIFDNSGFQISLYKSWSSIDCTTRKYYKFEMSYPTMINHILSKDPNKILNIIKAIKECDE